MKKVIAILLALTMVLSGCSYAASGRAQTKQEIKDTVEAPLDETAVEVEDGSAAGEESTECESAERFMQNVTAGWNLGCALSVFAEETLDGWGVMAYFLTPDGIYSRSDVASFDQENKMAEISWALSGNGVLQAPDGAQIDGIGIEIWNFSLGEKDIFTYAIDDLYYVTADGEIRLEEATGQYETDMGGGTGGGIVADLNNPMVTDVLEIHAKVTYLESRKGEATAQSITQSEVAWGNPVTTEEMIQAVRDRGFNLIRVQVSWLNHMDAAGNIEPLWLERVAEVVDYCMDAGVYCMLNTTGAGWLKAERETFAEQSAVYTRLWEQIAARFADYNQLLLFESCNEVLNAAGMWWDPPVESYEVMNELYQLFVNTVRTSGGWNETRNLVLNPYAATFDYDMNQNFRLPEDPASNHLIAQVHCYVPNAFCMNEINLGSTNFKDSWGSDADKAELDEIMKKIKARFTDELGIPVLIGEFGTVNRVSEDMRAEYVRYYAQAAEKYGIKVVIFDDGGDFAVFDRKTCTWPYEKIIEAVLLE